MVGGIADEHDAISDQAFRPVEGHQAAGHLAAAGGAAEHGLEVLGEESLEGPAQTGLQWKLAIIGVAEADVGEAVIIHEGPAIAGEVLAIEVDLDLGAWALDITVVGPQRHGPGAALEAVADGPGDHGMNAIGADDHAPPVFDGLALVHGLHADAVRIRFN